MDIQIAVFLTVITFGLLGLGFAYSAKKESIALQKNNIDHNLFNVEFYKLYELTRTYIRHELYVTEELRKLTNSSFIKDICKINFKYIHIPVVHTQFQSLLKDNEDSKSFSRFLDFVIQIYTEIDNRVLNTLQHRYFNALLNLGESANSTLTHKEINIIIKKYPWLWLMDIIRQIDEGLLVITNKD